jgi:AcrR family transcriptional regulator
MLTNVKGVSVKTLNRRERVRAATFDEIRRVACRLLVKEGPEAVTLRAIAREMGMTAPALYRYHASREDLVQDLVGSLYDQLTDSLERARDTEPAGDVPARLIAASRAFRVWALAHPREFELLFASPVGTLGREPACAEPDGCPLEKDERAMRFGTVFQDMIVALWTGDGFPVPPEDSLPPSLRTQLAHYAEITGTPLPPAALYVYLTCWSRLYGQVSLEVFGHLGWALTDPEPAFEAMLAELATLLGLGERYEVPARS